jgi:hypothetical protein
MTQKMDIDSLTTCLVTPDGARIRLNFQNSAGGTTTLELSTSCVQQLVNALPHLLSTALRIQHGDNCARDPKGSIAWALQ